MSREGVTMVNYLKFAERVAEKMQSPSCSPEGFDKLLADRGVSDESKHALGMIVFYGSQLSGKPPLVPSEWHDWARRASTSSLSRGDPSLGEKLAAMTDMELCAEVISQKLSISVVVNKDLRQVAAPALPALSRLGDSPRRVQSLLRSLSGSSLSSRQADLRSIAEVGEGHDGESADGARTPPRSSTETSAQSGFSPLSKIKSWGSSSKSRSDRKS